MMTYSLILAVNLGIAIVMMFMIAVMSIVLPKMLSKVFAIVDPSVEIDGGHVAIARVVSIRQTGVTFNQVPQMQIVLRIDEPPPVHEITIRQYVDLGNMPRAGERVRIAVDGDDRGRAVYLGPALEQIDAQ